MLFFLFIMVKPITVILNVVKDKLVPVITSFIVAINVSSPVFSPWLVWIWGLSQGMQDPIIGAVLYSGAI